MKLLINHSARTNEETDPQKWFGQNAWRHISTQTYGQIHYYVTKMNKNKKRSEYESNDVKHGEKMNERWVFNYLAFGHRQLS